MICQISSDHISIFDLELISMEQSLSFPTKVEIFPCYSSSLLFHFLVSFSWETIFPLSLSVTTLISADVDFFCASFDVCEKFARRCPATQTPTQKLESGFLRFSSQEIGSSLV